MLIRKKGKWAWDEEQVDGRRKHIYLEGKKIKVDEKWGRGF